MRGRAVRTAVFLVIGVAGLASTAVAQRAGEAPATTAASTGTVRGRVTSANGVPLRGAEVRVRDPNGRENRLATTDDQGRYQVDNLVPGQWTLSAAKGGYITQQYGQRGPFSPAEPITLAARERVDANFILRPGGAVAGRLFDEYGDPVAGARVQVFRLRHERGRRTLAAAGVGDQTDDTGAFRLYALPPGDYYLAASLRAAGATGIVEATVGVPSYYPGTSSLGEAQRLRLGPGEEMTGISFAVQPVRFVSVSGTVVLGSGAPAADTSLMLYSERGDFPVVSTPIGNFGRTGDDGRFTMPNVAPGSYRLQARAGRVFDPINGQGEEALVPLVVGPEGVSGLTVTTARTPPIVGTVVADSATPLPNAPIAIGVREPSSGADFKLTARRPDAPGGTVTFRVPGMQGQLALTVETPRGWMLKQVEREGRDITDQLFELRGSAPDFRVTLTNRVTRVSGTVRAGGRAASGATVVLFADDAGRWAYPTRHVVTARADDRGAFTVEGLPPASYLAVALDDLETGGAEDPDFLESLREHAERFSIDYDETKSLTLDLLAR
jgi:protocatechuate 3,4-dioxygenase beta subunit